MDKPTKPSPNVHARPSATPRTWLLPLLLLLLLPRRRAGLTVRRYSHRSASCRPLPLPLLPCRQQAVLALLPAALLVLAI